MREERRVRQSRNGSAFRALTETIGDAALGQIVGRHLDQHLVAFQHANAVLAHFAGGVGDDFVIVFKLHAEHRAGQQFGHDTGEFEQFFLGHVGP